jgi:hypothetical protein
MQLIAAGSPYERCSQSQTSPEKPAASTYPIKEMAVDRVRNPTRQQIHIKGSNRPVATTNTLCCWPHQLPHPSNEITFSIHCGARIPAGAALSKAEQCTTYPAVINFIPLHNSRTSRNRLLTLLRPLLPHRSGNHGHGLS